MKALQRLAFTAAGTISILIFLAGCQSSAQTDGAEAYVHIPPALPDSVYNKLTPGDVIIRQGNGPLSFHLMNSTKEDYSHCGVLVWEDNKWKVIHTLGGTASDDAVDGVQMQDLDEFVSHASDSMLFICHPVFDDSLDIKIPERAHYYLEQKVPFDHAFSIFSQDKLYCTELLFHIFRDVHGKNIFDIQKKNKSYMLMFSTFFHEELFTPVFHLKYDNR